MGGVDVANCGRKCPADTGPFVNKLYSYAGDPSAVVVGSGTPLEAWAGGSLGVFVHLGIDPDDSRVGDEDYQDCEHVDDPNVSCGDDTMQTSADLQGQLKGCCGYAPQLATDGVTGRPSVAWYERGRQPRGVHPGGGSGDRHPAVHSLARARL